MMVTHTPEQGCILLYYFGAQRKCNDTERHSLSRADYGYICRNLLSGM